MTFNDYWQELTSKNVGLTDSDTVMRISVASFKAQLEKAWHKSKEQCKENDANLFTKFMRKTSNPLGF